MKKYKMVIVENDEDEQFFMREGFSASPFDIVDIFNSGNELIEWLEINKSGLPDFILSDLNMPGKNGYDIIDYVKTHPEFKHIPVIITSTSSAQLTMNRCLDKGASEYMVKPDTFMAYPDYAKMLYSIIEEKQLVR